MRTLVSNLIISLIDRLINLIEKTERKIDDVDKKLADPVQSREMIMNSFLFKVTVRIFNVIDRISPKTGRYLVRVMEKFVAKRKAAK
ncbi:gp050 [Rhodococcus phage ReqiPoco6]|uniref:Gp050 n=1 Tax=Rhodococcus phage ReqiPoco6 TaxID=691964 RepID=D4P7R8_9CAUD|nr:gp050 [Rhodococcus phage ReqiPoco6]ADD81048.1 gp050 [Rhodococcus phage ReqiPoco6]